MISPVELPVRNPSTFLQVAKNFRAILPLLLHLRWGEGSPEGVVAAPVGTLYLRVDGGAATVLYVKETGTNTIGWVPK